MAESTTTRADGSGTSRGVTRWVRWLAGGSTGIGRYLALTATAVVLSDILTIALYPRFDHATAIAFDAAVVVAISAVLAIVLRAATVESRRESEERYHRIVSALHDGIVLQAADGKIIASNASAETILGLTTAQMEGRTSIDPRWRAVHEDGSPFPGDTHPAMATLRSGRPANHVVMGVHKPDGSLSWISINTAPLFRAGEDRPYAVVSSFADFTLERNLQEQLRESQKMEAVGRLAGGVAHDFNNLLTVVVGNAALAKAALPEGHEARADIEEIERAAGRAAALTRQMLAFARRQIAEPRALDLNAVVESMDRMLRRLIGEDVELATVTAADLGTVFIDPVHVEQVLVNLAVNARDAMPSGGRLTIETGNVTLGAGDAAGLAGVAPGEYVMLAVSDTGPGLSAEAREHLFEPFFTTKQLGKGTGLGLAMCYGIVQQAGGGIKVVSEPGRGASFRIYLPRIAAAAEPLVEAAPSPSPGGTETILLAEDEEKVRDVAVRALTQRGYRVLEAADGEDALRIAATYEGPIGLLVTDVVMPKLGGPALAARLVQQRPGLRVLYMSGYTSDPSLQSGVREHSVSYIAKPFVPSALALKVRQVLDASALSS